MARHPAGGGRRSLSTPSPPSFAEVADLLTGSWRVGDPEAFAAAMMAAPMVAGYPGRPLSGTGPGAGGRAGKP